ncbi:MAG: AmmeMemoRadiSam system protein B, partial [Candidatus Firestonebacteria bacterium]|nr:AmmeMemoRadiSam system protein B [Candidatus Firestonebacteria bacterium]
MIRKPIVSGSFYPGTGSACQKAIDILNKNSKKSLRKEIIAGIVPHAGWIFSGQIAFNVFASINSVKNMTFILLGAVHSSGVYKSAIYGEEFWETPLGKINID